MNKKEFKELDREQIIIAFNQLKDDYSSLFDELEQEKEKNKELEKTILEFVNDRERILKTPVISKDKIREKIEELKEPREITLIDEKGNSKKVMYEEIYNDTIKVLEKMLEE